MSERIESLVLSADMKFQIDRFVEMIKEHHGVKDLQVDELNGVGLCLYSGDLFYFQLGSAETAIMLFLMISPFAMTEKEMQMLNELLKLEGGGSEGSVVQMQDCELAYFYVTDGDNVSAENLLNLLGRMLDGYEKLLAYIDRVVS